MKLTQFWQQLMLRLALIGAVLAVCVMWRGLVAPVSAESTAFVRVIDASPGTGSVNVFVDGSQLLTNFQFASVSGYVPVQAGAHKIRVVKVVPTEPGRRRGCNCQDRLRQCRHTLYGSCALVQNPAASRWEELWQTITRSPVAWRRRVSITFRPISGRFNVTAGGETVITGLEYQQASNYLSVAPSSSYTFGVIPTPAGEYHNAGYGQSQTGNCD